MRTLIFGMALALALGACAGSPETAPQTPVTDPVISIEGMDFQNGSVTVEEGTTVTWVWKDAPMEHSVVFDDFESPLQAEGTFSHTFTETGSFDYYCGPHPFMKGTITVIEANGEDSLPEKSA